MKSLGLGPSRIFDSIAELLHDLFGRNLLIVQSSLQFWMHFVILFTKLIDLLNGVKTFDGRHKFLPRDLLIVIKIDKTDPFSDLE